MDEVLTPAEILAQFDREWVLLADPEFDEEGEVARGRVIYHSRDRDEFDRRSLDHPVQHAAVVYTGEIDPDVAFIL